jgi:uncharacterized phage-associated protein
MIYSAHDIAKLLITQSDPEIGDIISNLKLQKLLYYCQGVNLAVYKQPLFKEDLFAWQYGPVVSEVYHKYKTYGSSSINENIDDLIDIDTQSEDLIKEVYEVYGQYSALKLMNMTHKESPWNETKIGEIITHDKLINYFNKIIN